MVVGISLSEPHTSRTALRTHVCMLLCLDRPLTINYFTKIESLHAIYNSSAKSNGLLPNSSIGVKETGSEDNLS